MKSFELPFRDTMVMLMVGGTIPFFHSAHPHMHIIMILTTYTYTSKLTPKAQHSTKHPQHHHHLPSLQPPISKPLTHYSLAHPNH